MKALSLRPPWPYAIFHLGKDVENRTWSTNHRGPLVIHASRNWHREGFEYLVDQRDFYVPHQEKHDFGALVGIVQVVGVIDDPEDYDGDGWFFGDYGWLLANPREFKKPIPWRGSLGLFDVPDEIAKKVL